MCLSGSKPPTPAAKAPEIQPFEPPILKLADQKDAVKRRKTGLSSLRIDSTQPRTDIGSGVNLPI